MFLLYKMRRFTKLSRVRVEGFYKSFTIKTLGVSGRVLQEHRPSYLQVPNL